MNKVFVKREGLERRFIPAKTDAIEDAIYVCMGCGEECNDWLCEMCKIMADNSNFM